MFAIIYLIVASLLGRWIRLRYLSAHKLISQGPFYVKCTADFYFGLIPLTTLNYFLALLANHIIPRGIYPLLLSNMICLVLALVIIRRMLMGSLRSTISYLSDQSTYVSLKNNMLKTPSKKIFYIISFLIFMAWAWLLTAKVLRSEAGFLGAGFSVFSDYAPHTAVVSSFAKGRNFPTNYPHFAGDGVQYHFFFYFLSGNLHYLGLDLATALNLPSGLGMIAFTTLLGYIAVLWSRRDAAFLLAPMLVYLRSSNAIWPWLQDVPAMAAKANVSILTYIRTNEIFIGRLPKDDWGLWNLNVFANQRHFLFVLGVALLLFLIFFPSLSKPSLRQWVSADGWQPVSWQAYIPAFILLACLPYWHGSVTVALLLMMAWMAVFSRAKLAYLAAAIITLGFAFVYNKSFSGVSGGSIAASFQWGFIAEDKGFFAVLTYLWELLGLSLPALLILPFLQSTARKRVLATAAIAPLLFALTVSLTPDITVNHKYIMISQMLATILITDLILRLWHLRVAKLPARSPAVLAVLLTVLLSITGLIDLITYQNKNKNTFYIPERSAFQSWIESETDGNDIFLTPPWHYHPFFLTGRQAWYGHSYYAWSAGHDTATRDSEVRYLWSGTDNDAGIFIDYCLQNDIQYAIISDDLRSSPDFNVNESFFQTHFDVVANFPEQNNAVIYRIYE